MTTTIADFPQVSGTLLPILRSFRDSITFRDLLSSAGLGALGGGFGYVLGRLLIDEPNPDVRKSKIRNLVIYSVISGASIPFVARLLYAITQNSKQ